MDTDLAILTALDTLPLPVDAATVAHFARKFWTGKVPADEAAFIVAVLAALDRLRQTGDAKCIPNRFTGNRWSITDAGRANARQ